MATTVAVELYDPGGDAAVKSIYVRNKLRL